MSEKLASEKVILSSPMSFSGSSARIWKMTHVKNAWVKWLVMIPLALGCVFLAWCVIVCWYAVFGLWLVPYRLFRRSNRKQKKMELQHREMLEQVQRANTQNQ